MPVGGSLYSRTARGVRALCLTDTVQRMIVVHILSVEVVMNIVERPNGIAPNRSSENLELLRLGNPLVVICRFVRRPRLRGERKR